MRQCAAFCAIAMCAALSGGAAFAGDADQSQAGPTFGSRIDKPDGSSAVTIGRRLPTEWETKVGTDVILAPQASPVPSENVLRGAKPDQSTGSVWGSITMPGFRSLGFDKTSVEARVDGAKEESKLATTLSRSVPLGQSLSVTWQNSYSIVQPLAPVAPTVPLTTNVTSTGAIAPPTTTQSRVIDEALRFNIAPSGTTFSASAGASSSSADTQWHNKFSIEQIVAGPLKVTTSVEDAGTATGNKSITAGFKKVW